MPRHGALLRLLTAAFITLRGELALAQAPLPECQGADVHAIDLPVYHDRADSPRFTYRYQYMQSLYPQLPTVVVLPGGPGGPSIGFPTGAIPAYYNIIYTDPRGTNCNAQPAGVLPLDAFRTDYLARDVKAVIEQRGLTDYFIYGHSYGTVQGTVLTSILEGESAYKPRGLVLEAILGRYVARGSQEQIERVDAQWQRVRALVLPQVAERFVAGPLPLGYSSGEWASIIFRSLYEGDIPGIGNRLRLILDLLAYGRDDVDAAIRNYFDNVLFNPSRFLIDPRITAINCRELFGDLHAKDLVQGHLVITGENFCARAGLTLSEPYDARRWPLSVPLYYFQGEDDSVIDPRYAAYHYAVNPGAFRHFAFIGGGASHDPLSQNLTTAGCSKEVWDRILLRLGGEREALAKCGIPYLLTETPPAQ